MSKKNPDQLINIGKETYQSKSVIAFLGKAFYGKTVVSTLLYDALFHYFIPKNSDKFTAGVIKGYNTLYQTHKMMVEGNFPPPNLPGPVPEIAIEISNTDVLGGKIELFLRDMSGEDHESLLLTEKEPNDLVNTVLSETAGANTIGPFSYLVFAKMYVMLLDCSNFHTWRYEDLRFAQLVKAILDMKKGINETVQGKIAVPIAIILTKADTLPPDVQESAEDLIKKYTPQLHSRLQECHVGDIGYFKLGIDVVQASPDEIQKMEEEQAKAREIEKVEIEKQIQQEVEKAAAKARESAAAENKPADQIEAEGKQAGVNKRQALMSIGKKTDDSKTPKKPLEPKQKIKTPLNYTNSEYIRFISWIIKTMSKN